MTQHDPSRTPDQVLAEQVMQALLEGGLVRPADLERVQRGLSDGTLSAEDWITLAENALESPASPEHP